MTDISRRRALGALGGVGLGTLLAACSADDAPTTAADVATSSGSTATISPQAATSSELDAILDESSSCTLTRELTEGPYYFDVDAIRSDIREDREGTPLRLALRVQEADSCEPIPNAVVDIWHCDAGGLYSGFESASQGGPGGGRTDEETYLRGAQVTNDRGVVEFRTVYPGWYRGRTVHIHVKVHLDRSTLLTSQLFFDEDVTSAVYSAQPYASHSGRDTFNDDDVIFDSSLLLTLREQQDGWLGALTFNVAG
jgi:protocatechuate 3,4-dioxygenase beta subunit